MLLDGLGVTTTEAVQLNRSAANASVAMPSSPNVGQQGQVGQEQFFPVTTSGANNSNNINNAPAVQQQQQVNAARVQAQAQSVQKTQANAASSLMPSIQPLTQDEFKTASPTGSDVSNTGANKPTKTATQGAIQGFQNSSDSGQGGLGNALTSGSGKTGATQPQVGQPQTQQQIARQQALQPTELGRQNVQLAQQQASPIQKARAVMAQLPIIGPMFAPKNPTLNANKQFNAQWLNGPSKEPLVPQFFTPGKVADYNSGKVKPNGSYPAGRRSQLFYTYAANKALTRTPIQADFELLMMQQAFPELATSDDANPMTIQIRRIEDGTEDSNFSPESYV